MQKITPHLWYDREARQAAEFYVATFPGSSILSATSLPGTPSGTVDIMSFQLGGYELQSISAGPNFKLNPSISFHFACQTTEEVDAIWGKLLPGGKVLMELGTYPFSKRYGWLQDKFGLSWQIIHHDNVNLQHRITPAFLFVGKVCGLSEEAINLWTSVFPGSKVNGIQRYGKGMEPDQEGTIQFASFSLFGQEFGAMDSARDHQFAFNEALSFLVKCETQDEIDRYWTKLSAVPEAEQCGWLKDKFGVSWQIVPVTMGDMLAGDEPERSARVTRAFLQMKKIDLAGLEAAYKGK